MEELMNYLVAEGLSECEAKECLENFNGNVTEEDLEIVNIYESVTDLGQVYLGGVENLDWRIKSVVDSTALGKKVVESSDELVMLKSGRVIEFVI